MALDFNDFTREVQVAITSIKERIELAVGPEYDALEIAEYKTKLLLSAVVSVESCMHAGAGEVVVGAIQSILSSLRDLK